jgi:TPR repeat protein
MLRSSARVEQSRMNILDLRAKADAGNCAAQAILGICYLEGINTAPDYKEAFRLLSAAAAQGASRAAASLARMHAEGLGVPRNLPQAICLYKEAAMAGEFVAQIQLGGSTPKGRVSLPIPPRHALGMQPPSRRNTESLTEKNSKKQRITLRSTPDLLRRNSGIRCVRGPVAGWQLPA